MIGDILRRRPRPRRRFLNFFPFRPTHCRTPPNLLTSRSMVALNFDTTTLKWDHSLYIAKKCFLRPWVAWIYLKSKLCCSTTTYISPELAINCFVCFLYTMIYPFGRSKINPIESALLFLHCAYFHSSSNLHSVYICDWLSYLMIIFLILTQVVMRSFMVASRPMSQTNFWRIEWHMMIVSAHTTTNHTITPNV